jgi:hypothetical protein
MITLKRALYCAKICYMKLNNEFYMCLTTLLILRFSCGF